MDYEIVKHVSSKTDAQVVAEYTGTEGRQTVYFPTDAYRIYATGKIMASRYEADLLWGGKSISNGFSPTDAGIIPELGANRAAFIPANRIKVEYSRNGGSSWTDYGESDMSKVKLFSGISYSFTIGKNTTVGVNFSNYQLRVTILDTIGVMYSELRKFLIYVTTYGSVGSWCTIEGKKQSDYSSGTDNWEKYVDKASIEGWPGYNIINTPGFTTCGYEDNVGQTRQLRFTFGCTGANTSYTGLRIQGIQCFGGVGWTVPSYMAKSGHLYTWDYVQNALFPANVNASGFVKSGSSDSYVLLGGGGHMALEDLSIKKVTNTSFTAPSTPTVANYKAALVNALDPNGSYCVGKNVNVSADLIMNWDDDTHTVVGSNVYQMTSIGGYYTSAYGQWLLSTYGANRVGVVGRTNGSWNSIKWLAYTSDIPTNTNQLTNGAGFITGITSTMVTNALGYTPAQTDTKVTQTVTSSANSSTRPLLIGDSYSDASTFAPATTTASAYATHLAKFAPSAGILSLVGLKKMKTDGTMDTASDTKVWNTNGGVTDISGKQDKVTAKGSANKPLYTSADGTFDECTKYAGGTLVALNGTPKGGEGISIYAPTSGGTSGQFLKSNGESNAPTFETVKELTDIKTTNTPASPSRVLQNCKIGSLELPIYDCISTVDSNGKLNHVTGKAVYILDARLMTRSGQSIPVSCKRYSGTPSASAHWKITIPSDFTGSISNAYCYVKFVYDASASGSAVNT